METVSDDSAGDAEGKRTRDRDQRALQNGGYAGVRLWLNSDHAMDPPAIL